MKIKFSLAALIAAFAMTACDETTDSIGVSLTDNMDHLEIVADTFTVSTQSILADSVLSRNNIGYLGRIRDPETGSYITADFMVQFATLENYGFPLKDSIASVSSTGEIIADSCEIRLFYDEFYGDSTTQMKLTAYELTKPYEESVNYYTSFDPEKEGYVSTDNYKVDKVYSLVDYSVSESERSSSSYTPSIRIELNTPYTDEDGTTYDNYGTYIMRKYYADKDDDGTTQSFSNSYRFIHDVVPGFYFKSVSGLGAMPYIYNSQLKVYFRYHTVNTAGNDTIYNGTVTYSGTEEVIQTTKISNDEGTLASLVDDNTCTYLKTPAGIFTEMTLPVEEIMSGHEGDTLNTAKIVLTRLNNSIESEYTLDIPETLMMIPKDSLYSFFENEQIINNTNSFQTSYDETYNTYTFHNISGMINYMYDNLQSGTVSADWNKVVIIPVSLTTTTVTSGSTTYTAISKVVHDMSLTSTRLVGGSANPYDDIQISVIYSKFK